MTWEIPGQISMTEYLDTLETDTEQQCWTLLQPVEGIYNFPEYSDVWQMVECRVYYPETGIESTELYEYRDYTFMSIKKPDPQRGMGRITAWRMRG